ncbi:MAG TPA: J domain-containing protein [Rubrivivax sp.]|nr:J domain-containing protein [Rubrivivax sp.]
MKWVPLSHESGEAFYERQRAMPGHELLGVSESATGAELTQAYRRLVAKYHPDRLDPFLKAYSDRLMRLINAAYDQERRRRGL